MTDKAEPYSADDLRERMSSPHKRPWPRVFATLLSLIQRVDALEETALRRFQAARERATPPLVED